MKKSIAVAKYGFVFGMILHPYVRLLVGWLVGWSVGRLVGHRLVSRPVCNSYLPCSYRSTST